VKTDHPEIYSAIKALVSDGDKRKRRLDPISGVQEWSRADKPDMHLETALWLWESGRPPELVLDPRFIERDYKLSGGRYRPPGVKFVSATGPIMCLVVEIMIEEISRELDTARKYYKGYAFVPASNDRPRFRIRLVFESG
jgi:hypothetical protein